MKRLFVTVLLMCAAHAWGQADDVLDAELQAARDRLDEAARELADLQRRRGPPPGLVHRVPLPMSLGLILGRPGNDGIEVVGVTPEGPAAEAGLEAGDVITAIEGQAFDSSSMAPIGAAHRRVAELEPGEQASVDYLRGAQLYSASLTVRAPEQIYQSLGRGGAGVAQATLIGADITAFSGRGPGIALHELNPGLGRYFGVEAGLLVLEGGDDPEKLMPGDVVTQLEETPIDQRLELFQGLGPEPRAVTVIRDGGALTLTVARNDVMGGVGGAFATPVDGGSMRFIDVRASEGEHIEMIVNEGVEAPPTDPRH